MAAIIHPLLTLLASLRRQDLAQRVTYLQAENRILRSKLPQRITLNNQERRRLLRHGKTLGPGIKDLISIVSFHVPAVGAGHGGEPRQAAEVEDGQ